MVLLETGSPVRPPRLSHSSWAQNDQKTGKDEADFCGKRAGSTRPARAAEQGVTWRKRGAERGVAWRWAESGSVWRGAECGVAWGWAELGLAWRGAKLGVAWRWAECGLAWRGTECGVAWRWAELMIYVMREESEEISETYTSLWNLDSWRRGSGERSARMRHWLRNNGKQVGFVSK